MADLILSPRSSVDTTSNHFSQQLAGKVCGADIAAGQPMELRANGKLYPFANTGSFFGVSPRAAKTGQPVTAYAFACRFHAVDGGLIIGNTYYLSDVAGKIADAAGTVDTKGSFTAVSASDLVVTRSFGKVV
jgi:hypothetical protein